MATTINVYMIVLIVYVIIYKVLPALHSILYVLFILDSKSGNYTDTLSVTFEVGSSETCFNFSFVVSNDALDSEHLTLSIMKTTSRTEVEKGLGIVVIHIMNKDSRKLSV